VQQLDYTVAVILGIATILGALSAYYSALWGGNQSSSYNSAIMTMSESNTLYLESLNDLTAMELNDFKDDFIETQWEQADQKNDEDSKAYYESRMSPELAKIYTANEDSIDIAMEEYVTAYNEKVEYLEQSMDSSAVLYDKSKEHVIVGDKANTNGDKFTLVTVFFTIVLFFGGMATVTERYKLKLIYTSISAIFFIYSAISMFIIPMP